MAEFTFEFDLVIQRDNMESTDVCRSYVEDTLNELGFEDIQVTEGQIAPHPSGLFTYLTVAECANDNYVDDEDSFYEVRDIINQTFGTEDDLNLDANSFVMWIDDTRYGWDGPLDEN